MLGTQTWYWLSMNLVQLVLTAGGAARTGGREESGPGPAATMPLHLHCWLHLSGGWEALDICPVSSVPGKSLKTSENKCHSLLLECGPWASSIGITGSLLKMQNVRAQLRPPESESTF